MQGIAKHRYAASAFYEGVCRVSVRLNAGHGADALCRERNRTATKSNAVSHWRRWFIEVFSLQCSEGHCTAVNCSATQSTELNFKATRPALHGGLSESFSAQCMDLQYGAAQGKAQHEKEGNRKATRQGHSMSGFVEGLSYHGMAARSSAVQRNAGQGTASQRNAASIF